MRPYLRIEGPEKLVFPGTVPPQHVATPDLYLAWHAQQMNANARRWRCVKPVHAFVEHGRWVAACLNCRGGMLTRPDWRLACCGQCGAVYNDVVFPLEAARIELILLERPARENQSWLLGETVDDLLRENARHADEIKAFDALCGGEL